MNGWVDTSHRRWKDQDGVVSGLHVIALDRLACPHCRNDRVHEVLTPEAGGTLWMCVRGHSFDAADLPAENRNYFF